MPFFASHDTAASASPCIRLSGLASAAFTLVDSIPGVATGSKPKASFTSASEPRIAVGEDLPAPSLFEMSAARLLNGETVTV